MTKMVVIISVCAVLAGFATRAGAADDGAPPYLASPFPPEGSSNNSLSVIIRAIIADDDTGVNPASIGMVLDDDGVEPIIEPAGNDGRAYWVKYQPPAGLPLGREVRVRIEGFDMAGNFMSDEWGFFTEETQSQQERLPALEPGDGAFMSYGKSQGSAAFSWLESGRSESYRFRLTHAADSQDYDVDLTAADVTSAFSIVTFTVNLPRWQWDAAAGTGEWDWSVVARDPNTNELLGQYSEPLSFQFAPSNCTELSTPLDYAVLHTDAAPVFRWKRDPDALEYLFAMTRIEHGVPVGPLYTAEVPFLFTEIPVTPRAWESVADGDYIWSTVAIRTSGEFADYMLHHFRRTEGSSR